MTPARIHPWRRFVALSLLFFVVSAGTFSSLGVVLPAMVRDLRWTWTQAGLGFTFLGLACGLSSLLAAALIRRLGVSLTIFAGTALLVLGFAALASTHAVWPYLGACLILGVAFSLSTTVPGTHVLAGLIKKRSTMIGAYFTIGALGGVAGPLLYVALAPALGWRAYWWIFAALSAALGLFAGTATPGHQRATDAKGSPMAPVRLAKRIDDLQDWTARQALATPQFYIIVGAYTMYLLINTTAHGFAVEHLTERGISTKAAAEMLSLEALIGALVAVIGGWAGEKIRPRSLLIIALGTLAGGMAALALAHGYGLMLGYAVGVGIGFGLSLVASTMLLLTYFGPRAYLELYSIMCLLSTAAAIGPAAGGAARDLLGSFTGLFLLCAAAAVFMLMATMFMTKPSVAKTNPRSLLAEIDTA